MIFVRAAAFAVAALLASDEAALAAGPFRPFQSGSWSGGAYTDDRTGSFSHCSAGVAYDSGIDLFVVSTEIRGWWLGFTNPQWSLSSGGSLPIKLRFDERPPVELSGAVANAQLLLVALPETSQLIEMLRRSGQLTVIVQDKSFSLNLGGAATIMSELTQCVTNSVALEAHSVPSPSAPPSSAPPAPAAPISSGPGTPSAPARAFSSLPVSPPAPASGIPETRSPAGSAALPAPALQPGQTNRAPGLTEFEEIKLAKNFLLAARLPNARLIETDKPAALASFRAVWRSENAAGAVKIIPPGRDVTGVGIASDLISVDPQLCKGNFAATRSSDVIDGGVVFRAMLSCADGQIERTAQYFIIPRQKGGFAVFAVIGNSTADRMAAATGQKMDLFDKAAIEAVGPED